jgi:HEAT repeat protein
MNKQDPARRVAALRELCTASDAPAAVEPLRKALTDRNNYYVAKAAALAAELGLSALIPDLLAAFDRFLVNPAKTDPRCWAKTAIAQALQGLGHADPAVFLRGLVHVQLEPVWGGQEDTGVPLRGACAVALVQTDLDDFEILERLVDMLADPAPPVRIDAVRAIAQFSHREAQLLLRLKALDGDPDSAVVGECLAGLLELAPNASLGFVARFMAHRSEAIRAEAIAALGHGQDPHGVTLLVDAWKASQDTGARQAIVASLGTSRHDSACDFLLCLLENGDDDEAQCAIKALAKGRFRDRCRARMSAIVEARQDRALARLLADEFD